MLAELVRVANERQGGLAWSLPKAAEGHGSSKVRDYYLVTLAKRKSKPNLRYIGVLGNFVPWKDIDDLLALGFLFVVFLCAAKAYPSATYRLCRPRWTNPFAFVFGTFYSTNFLSTIMFVAATVNSGENLQGELGRAPFLLVFLGAGAVAAVNELLCREQPRPVGGIPATFAVLVHATLLFPATRYSLYGKELNGFALIGVHVAMPLVFGGVGMFVDQLPLALSGIIAGAASFCWFHEKEAARLLDLVGVYSGPDKPPSSLVLPLLGLNFLASQFIAQNWEF